MGCASAVRGYLQMESHLSATDIDFVTISSTGNASDFGNATITAGYRGALPIQPEGLLVEVKLQQHKM